MKRVGKMWLLGGVSLLLGLSCRGKSGPMIRRQSRRWPSSIGRRAAERGGPRSGGEVRVADGSASKGADTASEKSGGQSGGQRARKVSRQTGKLHRQDVRRRTGEMID